MPEIVEVCWISNYLNTFKGYHIRTIKSLCNKYKTDSLVSIDNLIIDCVDTWGKLLWFEFEKSNLVLLCHFGLHGIFTHNKSKNSKIEINITLDKDIFLYFDANIGSNIHVTTKEDLSGKINLLGEDFFKNKIDGTILFNRLTEITKNGKKIMNKKIVEVLLEQKKTGLGSGIGNYLVSEILYEAKLSPHTTLSTLLNNQILVNNLANAIVKILRLSYLTSNELYFKKLDGEIKNYIDETRKSIPDHYNYYNEVDIGDQEFSCKVYKKKLGPKGEIINVERIVSNRKCYWIA